MSCCEELADIGLIGLAVMGENLVLNMNDNGYKVCVFNRTVQKVNDFINNRAKGTKVIGSNSLEEFVKKLKTPRIIILMVMAGKAVDECINKLIGLLDKGDIIIDGGNSDYKDTQRRCSELSSKGFNFIGTGISGGEVGARYGASIMPGGCESAWEIVKPIFESIAAKVGNSSCVTWIGNDGAGHYVKMVHNGIEYGDMELICESYDILKKICNFDNEKISEIFMEWNKGVLESYLMEISYKILKYKENGVYLIDEILDSAGQKGTGKLTVINGLEMGIPVTLIGEAVFSRCLSSLKNERIKCSKIYRKPSNITIENINMFINDIKNALYASKIISYTQGFMLLNEASKKYNWNLDFGKIAMIWRGGCIIKSRFLCNIFEAFKKNLNLTSLVTDEYFMNEINFCLPSWRRIVSTCALSGIPAPAFCSALSFFDGYCSEYLPANLIQAQRDYFGAHTFEKVSQPGVSHHSSWGQD